MRRPPVNGQNHRFSSEAVRDARRTRRTPASSHDLAAALGARQAAGEEADPRRAEHLERQPRADAAGDQRGREQRERAEHEAEAAAEHPSAEDDQEEDGREAGDAARRAAAARRRPR